MHDLCFFFFFFLCSKIIFDHKCFLFAEINLTTRGPLYICLGSIAYFVWLQCIIESFLKISYLLIRWLVKRLCSNQAIFSTFSRIFIGFHYKINHSRLYPRIHCILNFFVRGVGGNISSFLFPSSVHVPMFPDFKKCSFVSKLT